MVSDAISCLLRNFNTLWSIIMTLYSYVEQVLAMWGIQKWQLLLSYFLSYSGYSDAISCPFCNLNTLWYIIMILYSYIEQVMIMCLIQEWQLLLAYFLSYFPLIVKAAVLSILKTVRIIFMKPYGSVEEVVTMYTKYGSSHVHTSRNYHAPLPPSSPPPKKKS